MIKIYNYDRLNLQNIENTKFPNNNKELEQKLSSWMYNRVRNAHDILEKLITLIEPNTFKQDYLVFSESNNSFTLKTTSNQTIEFKFIYGDIDEFPELIVRKDGIERTYSVLYEDKSDLILIDSYKYVDEKQQYTQYFFTTSDVFEVKKDNYVFKFYISNPAHSCNDKYLINEKLKQMIINTKTTDIIELFNLLQANLNENNSSYSISKIDLESNMELDSISVQGNELVRLKLTKQTKSGKSITIEDDKRNSFSINLDSEEFNLFEETKSFKDKQNKLVQSLKK